MTAMTSRIQIMAVALVLSTPLSTVSAPQSDHEPKWEEITPATGNSPSPRRSAAAIYNPIDHELILFAGRSSSGDQGDLWRFDLSAGAWERMTVEGTGPVPRFTHNAVYDKVSHRMVVWSGRKIDADGSEFFSDIWALDIAKSQWSLLHPSGDSPNRRYGTAAVYDQRSHAWSTSPVLPRQGDSTTPGPSIWVGTGGRNSTQMEIRGSMSAHRRL